MRRFIAVILTLCFTTTIALGKCAECETKAKEAVKKHPFLFTTIKGVTLGASTGLAAGWARYADQHEMQNVWNSIGYGAVAGLGAGMTAAWLGKDGKGFQALNDIDVVSSVGGGTGFLWGVISALFTGDSRRIASSAAWGQLAGGTLGLALVAYKTAADKYSIEEDNKEAITAWRVTTQKDSTGTDCPSLAFHKKF